MNRFIFLFCFSIAGLHLIGAEPERKRPIDGIMDNSFLVEEAYNQEAGVVQHIFSGFYGINKVFGPDEHTLDLSFTQEWPIFSQAHQFSYTVPYAFSWEGSRSANGVGDVLLNYRYQAYLDEKSLTAFAPRFSLIVPTGAEEQGFGNGVVGYQLNLPFSTTFGDRWFVHANSGLTFLPEVGAGPEHDLLDYNVGASAIYCLNERFHLMLEWVGNSNQSITDTGKLDREFSSVISPGARYAFNFRNGSQLVLGLGIPVGLTETAPDVGAFIYLSFEHSFMKPKER